jgi:hypothetical protein
MGINQGISQGNGANSGSATTPVNRDEKNPSSSSGIASAGTRPNLTAKASDTQTNDWTLKNGGAPEAEQPGAPPAIRALLADPKTRELGLQHLAAHEMLIIPAKNIHYKDEDGPWGKHGQAGATTDGDSITFFRNAFSRFNYWVVASGMDHEYSHWMDNRFKTASSDINVKEMRAYTYQFRQQNFSRMPEYARSGQNDVLKGYIHDYKQSTDNWTCKSVSDAC